MKKVIIVIIIIIVAWFVIRFIIGGSEDTWMCVDGEWVKHGVPSAPKPTEPCGKDEGAGDITITKELDLTKWPVSKMMVYKGVKATIPQLSLMVGFVKKEGENYIVSVEHTQESSCAKEEISLPAENSYICKGITYIFQLHPNESNINQVMFSVKESGK